MTQKIEKATMKNRKNFQPLPEIYEKDYKVDTSIFTGSLSFNPNQSKDIIVEEIIQENPNYSVSDLKKKRNLLQCFVDSDFFKENKKQVKEFLKFASKNSIREKDMDVLQLTIHNDLESATKNGVSAISKIGRAELVRDRDRVIIDGRDYSVITSILNYSVTNNNNIIGSVSTDDYSFDISGVNGKALAGELVQKAKENEMTKRQTI